MPAEVRQVDAHEVGRRLDVVRQRITDAGGALGSVEIMGVTKGFGPWAIEVAAAAGLKVVGESYAQELEAKFPALQASVRAAVSIEFIGGLQTNKVRKIAPMVDRWQSVDRPSVVREIAKRSPGASVLLQLDIAGVPGQGGCALHDAAELLTIARGVGLEVDGVMAIGPQAPPQQIRDAFRRAVDFADSHQLEVRSLGMTGDLESAIHAGSTMIRIGTALFGERPPR